LKRYLDEYITFGGYPKVVLTESYEEKKILLKDLCEYMLSFEEFLELKNKNVNEMKTRIMEE